ncbi:PspC domain-containing protein [Bacillus sinesaloumensis]|uniref:PspC domain-containing protein n=1 Tax=Litchfieldia sinesaloumensis TaxID=1926280 RepID=UPI00098854ED|nr:PspC domain-containing protein [Bacillus sinesaloumensis]
MTRKLRRSSTNKAIYGVCGGIATFFGKSPLAVRLAFLITASVSVWVYIFLVWALEDDYHYR